MKVSIITPSLNQAQFIERSIQSVLAQQWRPLEHMVFDGGSTDGTLDILKKYNGQLRWVSEPDNGQSDAVNKGIRTATGDVIGWLNSDDIYYPGAVKLAVEFLAAHPELDAVYGMAEVRFGYPETKLAGARMYVGNKTISGRMEAYAEIISMFRRKFGTVPDSWLFGYAHAIAKKHIDMDEHRTRFLFEKAVRSILEAVRWNRTISPQMTYRLLSGIWKTLSGRAQEQAPTIGPKPSWWWS